MLEDHLACPALRRWLPALLGDHACTWIAPSTRPSRAVQRLLSRWAAAPDDDSALAGLVLATPLQSPVAAEVPSSLVERVPVGALIVDLAVVARPTVATLLRPGRRRREAMLAATQRVRHWADRGLVDIEQWASLDPASTIVTLGLRGAHINP